MELPADSVLATTVTSSSAFNVKVKNRVVAAATVVPLLAAPLQ